MSDLEQLVIDAMHLLTAPDQVYRHADVIKELTTATPRLAKSRDNWLKHWEETGIKPEADK